MEILTTFKENFGFFKLKFQAKKGIFPKISAQKRNKNTREGHFTSLHLAPNPSVFKEFLT